MTFAEKIRKSAVPGDLFPELTAADKKYNYIIADIAVKIRNWRKGNHYTQKQLADYLGVTQSMVSKWESADYNFTIEKLVEIYDKLEIEFVLKEKPFKSNIALYQSFNDKWKSTVTSAKTNTTNPLGVCA